MLHNNKQQRQLEALAQARRDLLLKYEDLDNVDGKNESGDDVLDIDIESFRSAIQSNLNNSPLYYSRDSGRTN